LQGEARCIVTPAFTDAVKVIRQDPELWAEYRVKIKKAKPSGVLLSDIDDATRPDSDFASDDGGAAGALIELVTKQGELFLTLRPTVVLSVLILMALVTHWLSEQSIY